MIVVEVDIGVHGVSPLSMGIGRVDRHERRSGIGREDGHEIAGLQTRKGSKAAYRC